ncbi:universal stress protein [Flavobacterium caseinilyticum]|nr:universal stress protein [Flavobacterium caseinilyticum]
MKTILVPTDFSSNANNALKYANAFARAANHKILLLHTYIPILGSYNRIYDVIAEENVRIKKEIHKNLDDLCKKYVDVSCQNLATVGDPIDTILDVSIKAKVDLIIMGTHGASGLRQILFGSNTVGIISQSTIPVLAVPQDYSFSKIDTIVYASDLKNTFNELKHIIPIAKQLDATIEILNLNYEYNNTDDERQTIQKKIKSLSYKKIKFIEQIAALDQTMADQIKNYLAEHKPQILVMFPEEKTWLSKIFIISNTKDVANQLKLPLLSIKKITVKQKDLTV